MQPLRATVDVDFTIQQHKPNTVASESLSFQASAAKETVSSSMNSNTNATSRTQRGGKQYFSSTQVLTADEQRPPKVSKVWIERAVVNEAVPCAQVESTWYMDPTQRGHVMGNMPTSRRTSSSDKSSLLPSIDACNSFALASTPVLLTETQCKQRFR